MIERKIIIGVIVSTDFVRQIRAEIKSDLIDSAAAGMLLDWALEYFDKYNRAPGRDIEQIFYKKLAGKKIGKELAEEIEEDILPGLSGEYESTGIQLDSLLDTTREYFRTQRLVKIRDQIDEALDKGNPADAEQAVSGYAPVGETGDELIFDQPGIRDAVRTAFAASSTPLFEYPGVLGQFWNDQLVSGGFVGLLAPEKRGKSWVMLDMAIRAVRQGVPVAFFQAGDMTRDQQLRRVAIHLAGKSDKEKYCGMIWVPGRDCVRNQLNTCEKEIRECDFGLFEDRSWGAKELRKEVTRADVIEAVKEFPDYQPCYNCREWVENPLGTVHYRLEDVGDPLAVEQAEKLVFRYFVKKKRAFRLSTHHNDTLSVAQMKQVLNTWWVRDRFKPGLIVLDYADLMVPDTRMEHRHQQNQIWKELRGMSQSTGALLITATQADADSYERSSLKLKNFSEDKRKYAHVTAMFGLNQDPQGREKALGLLRINELLLREGGFDSSREVTVIQSLSKGKPILGSFF